MAATTTTPGRAVRRQVCGLHNLEYGQVYDPGVPGQREAVWLPPNCPQCEVELRNRLEAEAEVARLEAALVEETNRRAENDAGRDARIDAAVEADMHEQVMQFVAEFYATRRKEFEAYHNAHDWERVHEQLKEERRSKILAELGKRG